MCIKLTTWKLQLCTLYKTNNPTMYRGGGYDGRAFTLHWVHKKSKFPKRRESRVPDGYSFINIYKDRFILLFTILTLLLLRRFYRY